MYNWFVQPLTAGQELNFYHAFGLLIAFRALTLRRQEKLPKPLPAGEEVVLNLVHTTTLGMALLAGWVAQAFAF